MINEEVSAYHLVELHDAEAAFLPEGENDKDKGNTQCGTDLSRFFIFCDDNAIPVIFRFIMLPVQQFTGLHKDMIFFPVFTDKIRHLIYLVFPAEPELTRLLRIILSGQPSGVPEKTYT